MFEFASTAVSTVLGFALVFGAIVFFHEFGHFSAAKLTGMGVFEFALGFGPSLWQRKWRQTRYCIRALPLGGYVRVAGMDPTPPDVEGDIPAHELFSNKSLWQRLAFIAAGPTMNFVFAFLLLTTYHMVIAIPPTIQEVVPNTPAAEAGLQPGDQIIAADGAATPVTEDVVALIQDHAGVPIKLDVRRGKEDFQVEITPRLDPERQVGVIGVSLFDQRPEGLITAARRGAVETYRWAVGILQSIGHMITGRTRAELSGPVGIFVITGTAVQEGLESVLRLAILLNINLGLFNLFPIPLLDGFWLILFLFEALRGRPLEPEQRGMAQFVGLALLLLLLVFATYQDVVRFFPGT